MGSSRSFEKSTAAIGNKVRQGMEIAGTLKGIYDIGSTVYKGARFAAPLLAGLLLQKCIDVSIYKDVRI